MRASSSPAKKRKKAKKVKQLTEFTEFAEITKQIDLAKLASVRSDSDLGFGILNFENLDIVGIF